MSPRQRKAPPTAVPASPPTKVIHAAVGIRTIVGSESKGVSLPESDITNLLKTHTSATDMTLRGIITFNFTNKTIVKVMQRRSDLKDPARKTEYIKFLEKDKMPSLKNPPRKGSLVEKLKFIANQLNLACLRDEHGEEFNKDSYEVNAIYIENALSRLAENERIYSHIRDELKNPKIIREIVERFIGESNRRFGAKINELLIQLKNQLIDDKSNIKNKETLQVYLKGINTGGRLGSNSSPYPLYLPTGAVDPKSTSKPPASAAPAGPIRLDEVLNKNNVTLKTITRLNLSNAISPEAAMKRMGKIENFDYKVFFARIRKCRPAIRGAIIDPEAKGLVKGSLDKNLELIADKLNSVFRNVNGETFLTNSYEVRAIYIENVLQLITEKLDKWKKEGVRLGGDVAESQRLNDIIEKLRDPVFIRDIVGRFIAVQQRIGLSNIDDCLSDLINKLKAPELNAAELITFLNTKYPPPRTSPAALGDIKSAPVARPMSSTMTPTPSPETITPPVASRTITSPPSQSSSRETKPVASQTTPTPSPVDFSQNSTSGATVTLTTPQSTHLSARIAATASAPASAASSVFDYKSVPPPSEVDVAPSQPTAKTPLSTAGAGLASVSSAASAAQAAAISANKLLKPKPVRGSRALPPAPPSRAQPTSLPRIGTNSLFNPRKIKKDVEQPPQVEKHPQFVNLKNKDGTDKNVNDVIAELSKGNKVETIATPISDADAQKIPNILQHQARYTEFTIKGEDSSTAAKSLDYIEGNDHVQHVWAPSNTLDSKLLLHAKSILEQSLPTMDGNVIYLTGNDDNPLMQALIMVAVLNNKKCNYDRGDKTEECAFSKTVGDDREGFRNKYEVKGFTFNIGPEQQPVIALGAGPK